LESAAYGCADVLDAMTKDAGVPLLSLRVDGGVSTSDIAMQTQADLLQIPVVRPQQVEATALGAAFAAGLQAGIYTLDALKANSSASASDFTYKPSIPVELRDKRLARWRHAVKRCLEWEADEQLDQ